MERFDAGPGGAVYLVRRPDWRGACWAVSVRLSVAILGALAGAYAIAGGLL